jgi:hypothetical protein
VLRLNGAAAKIPLVPEDAALLAMICRHEMTDFLPVIISSLKRGRSPARDAGLLLGSIIIFAPHSVSRTPVFSIAVKKKAGAMRSGQKNLRLACGGTRD